MKKISNENGNLFQNWQLIYCVDEDGRQELSMTYLYLYEVCIERINYTFRHGTLNKHHRGFSSNTVCKSMK